MKDIQAYFYDLSDYINGNLGKDEVFTCYLRGENSDFVRFNNCKIRQGGNVNQFDVTLSLIRGKKCVSHDIPLSGIETDDRARIFSAINELRERLSLVPDDPYLLYATDVNSGENFQEKDLPESAGAIEEIIRAAEGKDLVGIYSSGGIFRGFSNSFGQRNWFEKYSFTFDWSLYHREDKAVKSSYAGFNWDSKVFEEKMRDSISQLKIISKPAATIKPGKYRVYLAPSALVEFVWMLSWNAFGLKSHRTKSTSLIKMIEEKRKLHPAVSMFENTKDGSVPNFQRHGFIKKDRISLIQKGVYEECLISPRSSMEYNVRHNGADDSESPQSFEMSAGDIESDDILKKLDKGMYINNTWYLNFSDTAACRITGMTRFAAFLVENGKIQSPINVMRFDESLYRMLGENLIGITKDRELIMDSDTYYSRSTGSNNLPGILVKDFSFTL